MLAFRRFSSAKKFLGFQHGTLDIEVGRLMFSRSSINRSRHKGQIFSRYRRTLFFAMRKLSHGARDWLRRVRRAGRQFLLVASVAAEEYRVRYELTACLKFKNVARFLPEWIEFHQIVGFEHFYLYNNNSTDDYLGALAPYREEGSVTLYEWPEIPAFPKSDEHCVARHRHEARWIAFLDDDEFLFPIKGADVRKVLKRYEAYPAVAVHWLMFGSSGHLRRPK